MATPAFGSLMAYNCTSGEEVSCDLADLRDFYIGRAPSPSCRFSLPEKNVSNLHVRIYTVIYQSGDRDDVNTLVYAQNLSRNGTQLKRHLDNADPGRNYTTIRLRRGDPAVLLHHKDQLYVGSDWSFTYILQKSVSSLVTIRASDEIRSREMKDFEHLYAVSRRKIGGGEHSQVFLAFDKFQDRQLVCKMVDKGLDGQMLQNAARGTAPKTTQPASVNCKNGLIKNGEPDEGNSKKAREIAVAGDMAKVKLIREVDILQHVCHPNIITIEQVFVSETTTYIFEELVAGGDLLSYVELRGGFVSEAEAAVIVRQVLEALKYLHGKGIVHRDLRPDNILMASLDQGARVILTDFSSARYFTLQPGDGDSQQVTALFSQVGAVEYAAPEMHRTRNCNGYSNLVDLWSVGHLAANIITGDSPMSISDGYEFSTLALSANLEHLRAAMATAKEWQHVSTRAKTFIYRLLVHQTERMTATQALEHEWLTSTSYAQELNAVYNRALQTWRTKPPRKMLVQIIGGKRADIPIFESPHYKERSNVGGHITTEKNIRASSNL